MEKKNQKLFIVVGVLILFGGISLAYFASKALTGGAGGETNVTTAVIRGATVKVEGILEFEDLDILPGHRSVSGIKVTATGNNELIPYNLIWRGTNTLTTPLNFTIYKTSEAVNVKATCETRTQTVGASKQLSEECNISNLDRLGTEIATGTINKNETKVTLAKDEFITAVTNGISYYYYVILEYPNLDEPQNYDLEGEIDGEVTVEESNIKPDINILAAYVIQDDGKYQEVDDIPQSGYAVNTSKSTCSNGATPTGVTPNITVNNLTKSGTSCYLYFDKYVPPITPATIVASIKNTAKDTPTTFSGKEESDAGIYKVADGMYGDTSYYWRGAATTNHVIFANKCWRIIRINGDKTIRLIYNGTPTSGTCPANGVNSAAVIMGSTNAEKYYATSDGKYDNPSYVGWTYTLSTQRTTSGTPSNAKTRTEAWFNDNNNFTAAQRLQVVEGKFCNDRNVGTPPTSFGWGTSDYVTSWSSWSSNTSKYMAYAAAKRIYQDRQPTLSCTSGDIYTPKVGAITADEVMFAGGWNENNTSYYLYTGQNYWTMSPYYWSGYAGVFIVNSDGYLGNGVVNSTTRGLRPVINLKSDILFAEGGTGIAGNPYVVS